MWVRSLFLAAILASGALALPAAAQDHPRHGDRGRYHQRHDGDRGGGDQGQNGQRRDDDGRGRRGWEGGWNGDRGDQDFKGPAEGRDRGGEYGRRNIRSLREVADNVRGRFGGNLISARLENSDRPFYVLRWRMRNGDVRDLTVDAESGQVR